MGKSSLVRLMDSESGWQNVGVKQQRDPVSGALSARGWSDVPTRITKLPDGRTPRVEYK